MNTDKNNSMEILVEMLTKNANLELDEVLFKKIKNLCRLSSENISHAFYLLMSQLRKEHAEIRYIILLAINELFIRSAEFRNLLIKNMEEFLELTLETNPDNELPPPKTVATRLKDQTCSFLKLWREKFGEACSRLSLAFSYLEACRNVHLNSDYSQPSTSGLSNRHHTESSCHKKTAKKKLNVILMEMQAMEEEILCTISQIKSCFDSLSSSSDALFKANDFIENSNVVPESASSKDESLRQHGITDLASNITIQINEVSPIAIEESESNISLINNLKELLKKASSDYIPQISKWTRVLVVNDEYATQLKKAINLRNALQNEMKKYEQLKFHSTCSMAGELVGPVQEEDSDNEFEDVQEKEGFELFAVENDDPSDCDNTDKSNVLPTKTAENSALQNSTLIKETVASCDTSSTKLKLVPKDSESTSSDWQDPELLKDIEAATGINLKMPEKRKKGSKTSTSSNKRKNTLTSVRTNIKATQNTTYNRLYKKLFKK